MKGEVTVQAQCLMPEKLIERATARGARFDAIRRVGDNSLIVECDAPSARLLLSLCQRFGIPARVTARRGRSALARFARRRLTLPTGLLLGVALTLFFLSRLWLIDITFSGETAALGDAAALTRALNTLGVRPGISRHLNPALIAETLQAQAGDYSYVGARIQGVRLQIEAVPEVPSPQVYDVDAARDLVCARDGIVVRAVARSGELAVQPGDTVRRGQLLIRGEELAAEGETRPIAALGEVVIRAWFEGEAELPLTETRLEPTGRTSTSARLTALGFEFPIVPGESYSSQRVEREYLPIGGLFLPVEIERVTRLETREVRQSADIDALKARLSALALADASTALLLGRPEDFEAVRSWINYENTGTALHARAVYEIQFNAAVTREALQGG